MGHVDQTETDDEIKGDEKETREKAQKEEKGVGQTRNSETKSRWPSATELSALFTPMEIGSLKLSHRIVLAPLTRCRGSLDGVPNVQLTSEYYSQRATKGGLLIAEATNISKQNTGCYRAPSIYTPSQIEAWRNITKAVRDKGAFFFLQIWHIGRASHSKYEPDGSLPVGPSPIAVNGNIVLPDGSMVPFEVPRELRAEDEIPEIIEDFKRSAKNAFLAGFDGVEIHGANGYLIDQFLHNGSNHRSDSYGGSVENRSRFLFQVMEAVQQAWKEAAGIESPIAQNVGVRLGPFGTDLDMSDSNEAELYHHVITKLNDYHPAYIHVIQPRIVGDITKAESQDDEVVHSLCKLFDGPVITAGGYNPATADSVILQAAQAEVPQQLAVAFGRLFISNPDFPLRVLLRCPLLPYNRATFYTHDAIGYTDQVSLTDEEIQKHTDALLNDFEVESQRIHIQDYIQLLRSQRH